MRVQGAVDAFDQFQRRHRVLAFPISVRKKYSDDQGGYLAATIACYGFFSVFPLLLVLVTGLGYLLHGRPHLDIRSSTPPSAGFRSWVTSSTKEH